MRVSNRLKQESHMSEEPGSAAHQVAGQLQEHGHHEHASNLRSALLGRAGAELLFVVREACQTILTAVEAIDPVSATMVEELRLEVDKRLKKTPGHRGKTDSGRRSV
jgi:hypothetical protein